MTISTQCDKTSQVNLELQIFDDTLTWIVRTMQHHGCVNTHHLGDFIMRVYILSALLLSGLYYGLSNTLTI